MGRGVLEVSETLFTIVLCPFCGVVHNVFLRHCRASQGKGQGEKVIEAMKAVPRSKPMPAVSIIPNWSHI